MLAQLANLKSWNAPVALLSEWELTPNSHTNYSLWLTLSPVLALLMLIKLFETEVKLLLKNYYLESVEDVYKNVPYQQYTVLLLQGQVWLTYSLWKGILKNVFSKQQDLLSIHHLLHSHFVLATLSLPIFHFDLLRSIRHFPQNTAQPIWH